MHDKLLEAMRCSRSFEPEKGNLSEVWAAEEVIARSSDEEWQMLRQQLQVKPEDGYSHLWQGLVLSQRGEFLKACEQFSLAIDGGVNHWRLGWYIAQAGKKLGNAGLVDQACAAVLKANPEFWFARELPKHMRGCYAQLGQDLVIEQFFHDQPASSRFFVEVGAFDGVHYSNVRRLVERLGWRGISVEPVAKNFKKLCDSYADNNAVRCLRAAASNQEGETEILVSTYPHLPEWGSDVATLLAAETARWKQYKPAWHKEKIPLKTLTTILKDENVSEFDLLCVDAEGHDLAVLQGLDWKKFQPKLVVVEYGKQRDAILNYVVAHGYSVILDNNQDLFLARITHHAEVNPAIGTLAGTRNYTGLSGRQPYDEIQTDVESRLHEFIRKPAGEVKTIVIVGGYLGYEISRLTQRYPQVELHVFEPSRRYFTQLSARYASFPQIHCHNLAVADVGGTLVFYEGSLDGIGSLLPLKTQAGPENWIPSGADPAEHYEVKVTTLDDFAPLAEKNIDLLWCDVQGAELKVLRGSAKILKRVQALFLEVAATKTTYEGQCKLSELQTTLSCQGFYLAGIGLCHSGNGTGNGLWLRTKAPVEAPAGGTMNPHEAAGKLNPHLLALDYLPQDKPVPWECHNADRLLVGQRFDLPAKTIFARHRLLNINSRWAQEIYQAHLAAFSQGTFREGDGTKNSSADYIKAFELLLDSIKTNGFDPEKSLVPVGQGRVLIDGAHRVAACLALQKPITCLNYERPANHYDADYFFKHGLAPHFADAIAAEFCRLDPCSFVVSVFPCAVGRGEVVRRILLEFGGIFYEKSIHLVNDGPYLLIRQMYEGEKWIGNWQDNFKGARQDAIIRFKGTDPLRVFIFSAANRELVRAAKSKIRALYELGNYSVHINDTHAQTLTLSQLLLNDNSVHFLNHARPRYWERFNRHLSHFKEWVKQVGIDPEYLCVDGSSALAAYGIRDVHDLDVLHYGPADFTSVAPDIESHNSWISGLAHLHGHHPDGIIFDPRNHFFFEGFKFITLDLLRFIKTKIGGGKDHQDIRAIDEKLGRIKGSQAPAGSPAAAKEIPSARIEKTPLSLYYIPNGNDYHIAELLRDAFTGVKPFGCRDVQDYIDRRVLAHKTQDASRIAFEEIRELKPALVYVESGYNLDPDTLKRVRQELGIPVTMWFGDACVNPDFVDRILNYATAVDWQIVVDRRVYEEAVRRSIRNVEFIPFFGYDHYFRPLDLPKLIPILFSGKSYDNDFATYPFARERLEFIKNANDTFSEKLHVVGENWEKYQLANYHPKRVPEWEVNQLNNQARIVLNFDAAHVQDFTSCRIYHALLGRSFIITRKYPGIEKFFKNGEHLVWFEDAEEGIALIRHFLARPVDRERIAQHGFDHIQKNGWKFSFVVQYLVQKGIGAEQRKFEQIFGPFTQALPQKYSSGRNLLVEETAPNADSPLDKLLATADVSYAQGNLPETRDTLASALRYAPQDKNLLATYGNILFLLEDFQGALQAFTQAVAIAPADAGLCVKQALAALQLEKIDVFEQALETALRMDPENHDALKLVADLQARENNFIEAGKTYHRILQKHPDDVEVLLSLGLCFFQQGDLETAEMVYERVLKVDAQNAVAKENLGVIREKKGAPQPAVNSGKSAPPLVTAIVSCYNSERFLSGCLEDLEAQTIAKQIEIIVVDTGSLQNERAIVEEFKTRYPNISYIRTEQRETIFAAWNHGILAARGVYVTNANSDDRHAPEAFEKMVQALEKHPVGLVYADCYGTSYENEVFSRHRASKVLKWPDFSVRQLLLYSIFGPQPMWRRSVHQEIGYFDPFSKVAGDYEFFIRLGARFGAHHIPEVLGLYFDAGNESKHRDVCVSETNQILRFYRSTLPLEWIYPQLKNAANAAESRAAALMDFARHIRGGIWPDPQLADHFEILAASHFGQAARLLPGTHPVLQGLPPAKDARLVHQPVAQAGPVNQVVEKPEMGGSPLARQAFSFCIVTGGQRSDLIRLVFASIRAQKIPQYEILVAGKYQVEPGITYVDAVKEAQECRRGAIRNKALAKARFENVVFLDDDCLLAPDWHEKLSQFEGQADVVTFQMRCPDGSRYWDYATYGGPTGHRILNPEESDPFVYATAGALLVKKLVFDMIGWDAETVYGEDVTISRACQKHGFVIRHHHPSCVYHADASYTSVGRNTLRRMEGLTQNWVRRFLETAPIQRLVELGEIFAIHERLAEFADVLRFGLMRFKNHPYLLQRWGRLIADHKGELSDQRWNPYVDDLFRQAVEQYLPLAGLQAPEACLEGLTLREVQKPLPFQPVESQIPVRWLAPVFNMSGYASEAVNFLVPLVNRLNIGLFHQSYYSEKFIDNLPDKDRDALFQARDRFFSLTSGIQISHAPAHGFVRLPGAAWHIGRTMFETDRIPKTWVGECNKMDEIWVPSRFNVETFAASGVMRDKLVVIPGAVNEQEFDPEAHTPLPLPNPAAYNFLSVFEWSSRKAWDVLLSGYFHEFSPADDVCLYLRCYLFGKPHEDAGAVLKATISGFVKQLGLKESSLPRFELLTEKIAPVDMPRLYKAADCLVAPSRGEGWGRPHHEAMMMGLPVIATGWSANTEFMNRENSYLIDSEMADVGDIELVLYRGHRWANPSEKQLRRLMRHVQQNPVEARGIGQKARAHVLANFSRQPVAERIIARIQEIERKLSTPVLPAAVARTTKATPVGVERKSQDLLVTWEGSFGDLGSLSHVNREITRAMECQTQVKLARVSSQKMSNAEPKDSQASAAHGQIQAVPPAQCQVHVRQEWPPNFNAPFKGLWVLYQPWEYGAVPLEWVNAAKNIAQIWTPSECARRAYIDSGIDPDKVKVVPNGIDPKLFKPGVPPMALNTKRKFKFLFVGGTIHRKGPDLLLKAYLETFTAADDVCLVIKEAGCPAFYAGQLMSQQIKGAQNLKGAPEILYLEDEIAPAGIPGLYAACHCLAHPYRGEGFGLPVLEAMACGLPVLVTAGGATDDFADDRLAWRIPALRKSIGQMVGNMAMARSGWLLEPSCEDLKKMLRWIYEHPEEAQAKARLAAEFVRQEYTWERAARAAVQHMRNLLSQKPPAAAASSQRPKPSAKAITLPPAGKMGHLGEIRNWLKKRQFIPAWEKTLAAIRARPFHPEAFLLLAEIALAAGDPGLAGRCARKSQAMAPGWKPAQQFVKHPSPKGKPQKIAWPGLEALHLDEPSQNQLPRLSVCLIVKNEERFLGKCLESVKSAAYQIVVVDTGSTDRTVEIAQEFGAEIYHFTWNDNFSDARNAALEHATGDWILMVDADEELSAESIPLLQQELLNPQAIAYRVAITDKNREEEGGTFVPRLYRNAPGLFYIGRVHEQIFAAIEVRRREWGLENKLSPVSLIHYGYTEVLVKERNKVERNLRLLEKAVEELPEEPNLLMNYGLELVRSGRLEEGLEQYREAFEVLSAQPRDLIVPELRETLLVRYSTHLLDAKRHAEVIRLGQSPLAQMDVLPASFHFAVALAQVELKQYREAVEQLKLCLARRNQPCLTPTNRDVRKAGPNHCLAVCCLRLEDYEGAEKAFQAAMVDDPQNRGVKLDYAVLLSERQRPVEALQLLHQLVNAHPGESKAWELGGRVALSKPDFLEVAADWTAEAERNCPNHRPIQCQRAEALLLSQQVEQSFPYWQKLASGQNFPAMAALVICGLLSQNLQASLNPAEEMAISREFVNWYRKLLNYRAQNLVRRINDNIEALVPILPTAAGVVKAALTSARQ